MPKVPQKSVKILPTLRMSAQKQLEVLRAYAASCGNESRSVTNAEVGKIVGLKQETVWHTNGFFVSIDLLTKSESGYTPSQEVLAYNRAYQWNQETAFWKVAPKLSKSWFGEAIIPRLRFRPLTVEEAISALGDAASVGPEAKGQIELLLFFLEQSGIVEKENGTIRLGKGEPNDLQAKVEIPTVPSMPTVPIENTKPSGKGGAIELNVSISVDIQEMGKWKPERITAFMTGLAQVLVAKGESGIKEEVP